MQAKGRILGAGEEWRKLGDEQEAKIMQATVAVSAFVRRQVAGSGKTYAPRLSFEELAQHARERMAAGHFTEGYRPGVRIVQGSREFARHFVCPLVKVSETTQLVVRVVRRRPEEEPYLQIRAVGSPPLPARRVEFILYHRHVLAETGENSTDAEWELVSVHAIPKGMERLPMNPVTMMRNQLRLPGGTAAHYSAEEWAEAIRFWQAYVAVEEVEPDCQ